MNFLKGIDTNQIIGTAAAVLAEPTIDQLTARYLPQAQGYDDIVKILGINMIPTTVLGKSKGSKAIIGGFKRATTTLATANLVRKYVGGAIPATTSTGESNLCP